MMVSTVLRSAIGHVREPVYLNAYALIVSNLLTSGLGIVYWGLAARFYAVDVVGVSAAVTSLLLFLSGVSQLNLRVALLRLVPEAGAGTRRLVIWAYAVAIGVTALVSLVVYVGAAVLGSPWSVLPGLTEPWGIGLLVVGTVTMSIFNLQDGVIAGLRRTVWVPLENGAYALAKIVLLLALVTVLPALGIVASYTLPTIAAVAIVSVVLFRRWIPAHQAAAAGRVIDMDRQRVLEFVAADTVGALFGLASTTLVPVLVVAVAGPVQGAYFAMAWAIVIALNLFPINMAASMTIETVHARADLGAEVRRVAVHMARILLPILIAVEVLAPFVLRIFGQAYADNATDLLRIACLALVPFAVNVLAMAMARVAGRGRDILAIQASVALLTLVCSVALLPTLGLVGVAVAWLAAQTIVAVATFWRELLPALRGGPA